MTFTCDQFRLGCARQPRLFALALIGLLGLIPACGDDDGSNDNQNVNDNTNGSGVCGDGALDPGEQCDDGTNNSDTLPNSCRADCREAHCGDGVTDDENGEECDDGNVENTDACLTTCVLNVCGDGYVNETMDGTAPVERCDDGNTDDGDSCRGDCLQDMTLCGNGVLDPEEQCDEGGSNNDSIPNRCRSTCVHPRCGDGVADDDYSEGCDDGNADDSDACLTTCVAATCGDGHTWAGHEGCDDGNVDDTDACLTTCVAATCGDGHTWAGHEDCDDGNDGDDTNACLDGCIAATCGDGHTWVGQEGCDDGNDGDNTDECLDGCIVATCGDGYTRVGHEACDDGNDGDDTNACLDGCIAATCGDGHTWAGQEGCDDGNDGDPTDGCLDGCIALNWLSIPAGTFTMGNNAGSTFEMPEHSVSVPAFEMLESEVTQAQYKACITNGPCTATGTSTNCHWDEPLFVDHPVTCVNWSQASSFCTWVGGRLPSEAEWEYAAKSAGQAIAYPWGSDTPTCTYTIMSEGGNGCGQDQTWSVCSKPAGNTDQGLCNMAGNVAEWVEDDYHANYTGAPADGSAWVESPRSAEGVIRGGIYTTADTSHFRTDYRYQAFIPKASQLTNGGFRCAR